MTQRIELLGITSERSDWQKLELSTSISIEIYEFY